MAVLVGLAREARYERSVDCWEERLEMVATSEGILPTMMPFRGIQCDMLRVPETLHTMKRERNEWRRYGQEFQAWVVYRVHL